MTFRTACLDDCGLLAELNHQLIRDEGHRNAMTIPQLEQRMRGWLTGEYRSIIFEENAQTVAYALFSETPEEVYLRQFFVVPLKRRHGLGRRALGILRSQVWPMNKRLTVEVLVANRGAVEFWHSVGYVDYALRLEITPREK